jgi:SRSO17 transposase
LARVATMRKSIEPMAARMVPDRYDRLHHFISDGIWDAGPIEKELARQADRLIGGSDAFLVIDDTSLPKKGKHSVGVARNMHPYWAREPIARRWCP